ncbi:MAG: NAD(+)/NADH kinase [Erysipelotrichia bacterium]|nr:NAD(+)/NADH kinase [Candidatus Riflebacteria bacterium]NCB37324.1 NAD(+)/NADH kinase [Erysipelotrichia bacterium]
MKKPIKKLAFICHPARESLPPLLKTLLQWSEDNGMTARLTQRMARIVERPELGLARHEMASEVDMVVVLGGDGTILETARAFAADGIPIAGINLGHLGFLTLEEPRNAIHTLEKIRDGKFRIENRMMLYAEVRRKERKVFSGMALNDIVIQKEPMLRVINIDVSISGSFINTYHGDGLIFSTPTGSTAYSLSAGGPIVPPWVNVIILCPLNCHTLSARPVITSDQEVLTARVCCRHSKVDLVLDGQESFRLDDQDEIKISRAQELGRIVVFKSRNFFEVLRKKMKWG